MKPLVCDICDGKLKMISGGIAVCENCGMEYTKERMQEKIQEIKCTVVVENKKSFANYLILAENAFKAGNNAETEKYCNKIIEIDPTNYKVWFLKGKAAAWQSTLLNIRLNEAFNCYKVACENCPEEKREALIQEVFGILEEQAMAILRMKGEIFHKFPSLDEGKELFEVLFDVMGVVGEFIGTFEETTFYYANKYEKVTNDAIVSAWNDVILYEYEHEDEPGHPSDYEFNTFIDKAQVCISLLDMLANIDDYNYGTKIISYKNLIIFQEQCIDSCSWDYDFNDYGDKYWYKSLVLDSNAVSARKQYIEEYKDKIRDLENKINDYVHKQELSSRKEYWEEHKEEKQKLDNELDTLEEEIKQSQFELKTLPEVVKIQELEKENNKLVLDREQLGVLNIKERKGLKQKIDSNTYEIKRIRESMSGVLYGKEMQIEALKQRKIKIRDELTKSR